MKLRKWIFFFFFLLALSLNALAGTVYYVDSAGGNDSSNGQSLGTPWKTMGKANATMQAGDTVYIRSGEYYQSINPANAGTSSSPITYHNYASEVVTIADIFTGAQINRDWIVLDGINFTGRNSSSPTMGCWIKVNGDHCTIQNCTGFYGSDYGGVWIEQVAYTKILNCEFGYLAGPDGSGEVIRVEGNHTLFDGNTVYHGTHNGIGVFGDHADTQYNIFRNNIIYNPVDRGISWGQVADRANYLLCENNIIRNCVSTGSDLAPGIQTNGAYVIVRRNQIYDIDGAGIVLDSWPWEYPPGTTGVYKHSYNKIYNNTFVNCGINTSIEGTSPGIKIRYRFPNDPMPPTGLFPNGSFTRIGIKNNMLRNSSRAGIYFEYGTPTVSAYDLAGNWLDSDADPLFMNASGHDYRLQSGSPCRNNGVFLTTITSATGSGTSFVVADAGYFCDGWGIIAGDEIQIQGDSTSVTVTDVNYATNTIAVDTSVSWTQGIGVTLAYSGSAPDIGVFEYTETDPIQTNISALPTSGLAPLVVSFTGGASGGTSPYTYSWNFGDSQSATTQNPSHTYASANSYTTTLTVTDNIGASDIKTMAIVVSAAPIPLAASASGLPLTGVAPLAVSFTGGASGGTSPYTYSWDFGDSQSATTQNPSNTYASAGSYTTTLTVTDNIGAYNSKTVAILVSATPIPLAAFASGLPLTGVAPLAVSFTGGASGGTSPYTYRWNFGDSHSATTQNPSHTYASANSYTTTLTVTDHIGAKKSKTVAIVVSAAPITLAASASGLPLMGVAPLAVSFTGGASGGTSPYTYSWGFGDSQSAAIQNPSNTYASAGSYTTTLTVTDNSGANNSKTVAILVSATPITLVASASGLPLTGVAPLAVSFTGGASGGTSPYTYSWGFGDSQTASEQNPSHIYTSAGDYSATLTCIDNKLISQTAAVSVTVSIQPESLAASITASPTSGSAPLTVSFSGSATGGTLPYITRWNFGDGQTLTASNPNHTYSSVGDYTATLSVTDGSNASDEKSVAITVSSIYTPPSFSCMPDTLIFGATIGGKKTRNQPLRINKNGTSPLTWTIQVNDNWLTCSPDSGKEGGKINVSVNPAGLSVGTYSGIVTINSPEASPSSKTIQVLLKINDQNKSPIGFFDTPREGAAISGSIPVSGWTLDDIEVAKVEIKRNLVPGEWSESAAPDGLVFIGEAVFIEGARPDIEQKYPDLPQNSWAGWGYMMLTYGLPNRGNGTFTIYAIATDTEGSQIVLGRKTIISDNAHSLKPFGTIDTPGQGETAGGTAYTNFGWALTPPPKTIPRDGSTIWVWIDGVKLGHPLYDQRRKDIADAYPEYNNAGGAIGFLQLDMTKYQNGIHTIGWSVADDQGCEEGIGSKFFSVDNVGQENADSSSLNSIPIESALPAGNLTLGIREIKKGFTLLQDAERKWDASGIQEIIVEGLEPVKIVLNSHGIQGLTYSGWEGDADRRRRLPVGSTLDSQEGVFSWIPAPGFVGSYDLCFIAEKGSDRSNPVQIKVTVALNR